MVVVTITHLSLRRLELCGRHHAHSVVFKVAVEGQAPMVQLQEDHLCWHIKGSRCGGQSAVDELPAKIQERVSITSKTSWGLASEQVLTVAFKLTSCQYK